jgi:hypothetical protein
MKPQEKQDAKEIRAHIDALKKAKWLGSARIWWPSYLFHFTDIQNAVNILTMGELLSRVEAEASNQIVTNGASPEVISQTEDQWKDHVRLYFRPRTPTQFRNEGFRPVSQQELGGAHCPVPIYLLFDSAAILSRQDALFSAGNLAAQGVQPYGDAESFKQIPFELVYHDTWFDPPDRGTVIFHRNAEVIVPKRLDLSSLQFVWCRSQAEYDTLLYLLPPNTRTRWVKQIGVDMRMNLFVKRWTYVEDAELNTTGFSFQFNKGTQAPGPFRARVTINETITNDKYEWGNDDYQANGVLRIGLSNLNAPQDYSVRLFLDDRLAFAGRYREDVLPF